MCFCKKTNLSYTSIIYITLKLQHIKSLALMHEQVYGIGIQKRNNL